MKSYRAQRLSHTRVIGAIEPLLHLVDVNYRAIGLTHENDIVPEPVDIVAPDRAARKHVQEGRDLALDGLRVTFVQRDPLSDDAAGIQMPLAQFEVLPGVECGSALYPRMNRVRRDDVEFVPHCEHMMPCVIVDDLGAAIVHHAVVL